jgi:hypothetical protein
MLQAVWIAGSLTLALLVSPTLAFAHHDDIPDPPPRSVSNRLAPIGNIDRSAITVSGLSSGGFFAHQFHVAFSSVVNGAGIIAGGPFGCVENIPNPYWMFWPLDRVSAATIACTHYYGTRYFGLRPSPPKAESSVRFIREAWQRRVIDDPTNLADDRVWLFHGELDEIVPEDVASTVEQVYRTFGVRELHADRDFQGRAASHGMPVARMGRSKFPVRECDEHKPPFVMQCGFEAAELLLRHLYPESFRPASDDPHQDGTLLAFDQAEFFDAGERAISLARVGYVYVPASCAVEQCRLHVAFHGCKQDLASVHDDFIRDAAYNRWAASNAIVVLYPQATASSLNPNACWDFWGYTGPGYYGQEGTQMRAVKAMVDRILGP